MIEQPTGIIKCLPASWLKEKGGEAYLTRTFDENIAKRGGTFWMSFSTIPKLDVLHCYLLIAGRIRYRLNIVSREPGSTMRFTDQKPTKLWTAKHWVVLGAPVVKPPEEMPMRGFQGFRYTGGLW